MDELHKQIRPQVLNGSAVVGSDGYSSAVPLPMRQARRSSQIILRAGTEGDFLSSDQTLQIGALLMSMLLKMKHNGAVDIAHEGLCSIVKR